MWCGDFGFQCHCRSHNLPIHSNRPSHNRWGRARRCSPRAAARFEGCNNVSQYIAIIAIIAICNYKQSVLGPKLCSLLKFFHSWCPFSLCQSVPLCLPLTTSSPLLGQGFLCIFRRHQPRPSYRCKSRPAKIQLKSPGRLHLRLLGKSFRSFTVRLGVIAEISVAQHCGAKATSIIETLVQLPWHATHVPVNRPETLILILDIVDELRSCGYSWHPLGYSLGTCRTIELSTLVCHGCLTPLYIVPLRAHHVKMENKGAAKSTKIPPQLGSELQTVFASFRGNFSPRLGPQCNMRQLKNPGSPGFPNLFLWDKALFCALEVPLHLVSKSLCPLLLTVALVAGLTLQSTVWDSWVRFLRQGKRNIYILYDYIIYIYPISWCIKWTLIGAHHYTLLTYSTSGLAVERHIRRHSPELTENTKIWLSKLKDAKETACVEH